jgi:hypothetical protein
MEVYDPTCGSGGLLVKCEVENGAAEDHFSLFDQFIANGLCKVAFLGLYRLFGVCIWL